MDKTTIAIQELIETVRTLRSPGGCNWDREQTLETLRPYMLEEAYEVADAVDKGDMDDLRKELGDLLLHIIMSAEICREKGDFDLAEVAGRINEKLKRRHPHVFSETSSLTPQEVEKQWEAIKAAEKKKDNKRFFDSIPGAMPALQKAWRIQQRASEVGYPWPDSKTLRRNVAEALNEGEETLDNRAGSILFNLVNLLRLNGIEPEKALREKDAEFIQHFHRLEELLHTRSCTLSNATAEQLEECIAAALKPEHI